ncbi:MAG: membrane protein insertion efficiency factor YidD [Bacteroidota bacterium]
MLSQNNWFDCLSFAFKLSFLFFIYPSFCQSKNTSFDDYLSVYQKFVSNIRGGECQMYPSCSNFAMDAFKKYNPIEGFTVTADRLLRCSHDISNYDLTLQNQKFKLIDFANSQNNSKYILGVNMPLYAYSDTVKDTSKNLKFIKYLVNKGLHQQALLEINRCIFNKELGSNIVEIYINYIICLQAIDENEKILFDYEIDFPSNIKDVPKIMLEIGNTWSGLKNYPNSIKQYKKVISSERNDSTLIDEAWMLKGISHIKLSQLDSAKTSFENVSKTGSYGRNLTRNLQLIDDTNRQKIKSAVWGGILGIIPGAGYLYASHRQTAFSSLIINSLFAYGAYTSFKTNNVGVGILASVIGVAFYIGNIQGSVKSVKRFNQAQRDRFLNRISLDFSY